MIAEKRHSTIFHLLAWLLLVVLSAPAWADEVTVEITGVEGPPADNVRAFLAIAAEPEEGEDPWTEKKIRRLHRQAPGEIESALQPFGYYEPTVESSLTADGEDWMARYAIDPGPATKVETLELRAIGEGAEQPAVQRVLAQSKLTQGQRLNHGAYQATKSALLKAAYDLGYLDAKYKAAQIQVNPQAARAEIRLVLNTGPQYYFGDLTIKQDVLADDFLRRYVLFEPGQPFNTERLTDLQLALTDTDYFSQVEIEAPREGVITAADGGVEPLPRLPIVVRATPRKPQKYTASAGFGTDTGPRVGLGAEYRRINRRGHKVRADLRVSLIEQALTARYIIPIDEVVTDTLSFGATVRRQELGDADSDSAVLFAAREDGWRYGRRRLYLNLERENFDFGEGSRTADLLYPGITLTFQRADNTLRTRRGIGVTADLHGGTDALISSTNFVQASVEGRAVLPATSRGRILLRGRIGATETDDFDALPPTQRFFTGGDRTVRGYGYQEISPENADGDDIGGQYLAAAGVEAEYLLYGDFGAAVFFDVGDAASDISNFNFQRGVGIGARWLSPVGTVRLDFAHPLDDPDSSLRIHFSLGPDL